MDRLETMRVFAAVADLRGFAPAARQLGLSAPAVTRAVRSLEEHLGATLLRRTTRSVALTAAGERFHADCRRLLAELAEAEARAGGDQRELQGRLAITAPLLFGRLHVAPLVHEFLREQPRITVRCHYTDHLVHLLDDGFDVAVRIARLPDSGLHARRVGALRRVLVAAPAYLDAHGRPDTPAAVAGHDAVGYAPSGVMAAPWAFVGGGRAREAITVQPRWRLQASTSETVVAAAVAGFGLARVLAYQVAADVRAGRLEVLLAGHEPEPVPVQLVHAEGRTPSARTRAFVDLAWQRLRAEPVLNGRFE